MQGIELIKAERERQVSAEGWTAEHDDEHTLGELSEAAFCYAKFASYQVLMQQCHPLLPVDRRQSLLWPWTSESWNPSEDVLRNLVKAGALIAAEIDRLQRLQQSQKGGAA